MVMVHTIYGVTDTNCSRTEAIEQMLLKPRLSTVSNVDWTIVRVGAFKATASTARHYQSQSQINSSPAAVAGRRYQQQQHRTSLHAARMMIMMIMTLYKELHIVSAWQRSRWGDQEGQLTPIFYSVGQLWLFEPPLLSDEHCPSVAGLM